MNNKGQLLQDPFLNALRREHVPVSIYLVNGEERKRIHLAMLMAGVFTQQLWLQAQSLLESIELDKQLIQGLLQNYVQAFFANQVLASNQESAKMQDTRISLDHQSLLEKPEMREIYRNMVELVRQKSI